MAYGSSSYYKGHGVKVTVTVSLQYNSGQPITGLEFWRLESGSWDISRHHGRSWSLYWSGESRSWMTAWRRLDGQTMESQGALTGSLYQAEWDRVHACRPTTRVNDCWWSVPRENWIRRRGLSAAWRTLDEERKERGGGREERGGETAMKKWV